MHYVEVYAFLLVSKCNICTAIFGIMRFWLLSQNIEFCLVPILELDCPQKYHTALQLFISMLIIDIKSYAMILVTHILFYFHIILQTKVSFELKALIGKK